MANRRVTMRKIRQVLRPHNEEGMSVRENSASVCSSVGTVQSWLAKVREARLEWPLAEGMSDEELGTLIYGDEGGGDRQPDWQWHLLKEISPFT